MGGPVNGCGLASRTAAAVLLCSVALPAWCQIYLEPGQPGEAVVLSNFRSADDAVVVVEAEIAAPPAAIPATVHASTAIPPQPSLELRKVIEAASRRTQLPYDLLDAVIRAESGYDPHAISARGARGLMQLMPDTGKRFGARDLFSVEENVAAGANYLQWLMSRFNSDLELVLAGYNAGEQAVIRAGRKVPDYPETQAYVRKVLDDLRNH